MEIEKFPTGGVKSSPECSVTAGYRLSVSVFRLKGDENVAI